MYSVIHQSALDVFTARNEFLFFVPGKPIGINSFIGEFGLGTKLYARLVEGDAFEADIHEFQSTHVRMKINNHYRLLAHVNRDLWKSFAPDWLTLPAGEQTITVPFDLHLQDVPF